MIQFNLSKRRKSKILEKHGFLASCCIKKRIINLVNIIVFIMAVFLFIFLTGFRNKVNFLILVF